MTEVEVLKKLEEFKNAIISLKKRHAEEIEQLTLQNNIAEEGLKKQLKEQEETLSKRILELQKTEGSLTDNIDQADNAYATLAHRYNNLKIEYDNMYKNYQERNKLFRELEEKYNKTKETEGDKKYTEDDLRKLLQKASEKTKIQLNAQEAEINRLNTLNENLSIANRSLENELNKREASEEIDKVLEGKITEKEMDEILTPKSAEEEAVIKDLLTKPTKVVKLQV